MNNEFSLEYQCAVKSPTDAHYARTLSNLLESAPNPLSIECAQDDAPFSGRFNMRACGDIGLSEIQLAASANSKTVFISERARKHIARNLSFEFNIAIWLDGESWLKTGNSTHAGKTGDFVITNTDAPFSVRILNRAHCCTLSLPATWDRIGDTRLENNFRNVFSGSDRRNKGLVDYARHLLSLPNALALPGAAEKLYDVIALALNPRATSEHQAGFLALIRNYIDMHYTNPDLSPSMVAVAFDISVSYLHRMFAACDTSFTEYIIEQRLLQARRVLVDPRCQHQTILSIAYDCGFRNINHFGLRFRMRYGYTPGEFRRVLVVN